MAYASPRGILRSKLHDQVHRPRKLRAYAKHRDDLATLKAADRKAFNGFGFLNFIKRTIGADRLMGDQK